MLIVADKKMERWLKEQWDGTLNWNSGNIPKLTKHEITKAQIEQLFAKKFVFMGQVSPPEGTEWKEQRHLILGETGYNRKLTIIWTTRGFKIRPICCRGMRDEEKAYFQTQIND